MKRIKSAQIERRRLESIEAYKLRTSGHSISDIAAMMGKTIAEAKRLVDEGLALSRALENENENRQIMKDRLRQLVAAFWPKAMEGDSRSAKIVLDASEQESRIEGLYEGPGVDRVTQKALTAIAKHLGIGNTFSIQDVTEEKKKELEEDYGDDLYEASLAETGEDER